MHPDDTKKEACIISIHWYFTVDIPGNQSLHSNQFANWTRLLNLTGTLLISVNFFFRIELESISSHFNWHCVSFFLSGLAYRYQQFCLAVWIKTNLRNFCQVWPTLARQALWPCDSQSPSPAILSDVSNWQPAEGHFSPEMEGDLPAGDMVQGDRVGAQSTPRLQEMDGCGSAQLSRSSRLFCHSANYFPVVCVSVLPRQLTEEFQWNYKQGLWKKNDVFFCTDYNFVQHSIAISQS